MSELECPNCGEILKRHKEGAMRDSEGNAYQAYCCDDCEQMYLRGEGDVAYYVPFDHKGKRLPLIKCHICAEEEPYRQRMIWVLYSDMFYKPYCKKCAVRKFEGADWLKKGLKVSEENVHEIA